jgi:integration host factor subunit beta
MTRSELSAGLARRFPQLAVQDAYLALKVMLDAIALALAKGDRVEIRGFGCFALTDRLPRVGRNPKTGQPVDVPAKAFPHFKPGKELRERVNARHSESSADAAHVHQRPKRAA